MGPKLENTLPNLQKKTETTRDAEETQDKGETLNLIAGEKSPADL